MIIGVSLLIILMLIFLSLILGQDFLASFVSVGTDTEAIVDGISSTFVIEAENVLFYIDTSTLIVAGISLLTTLIIVATFTGIQVLGSGLSPSSVRTIILVTTYIGIWTALSVLAFNLINSIPIFGYVIYIGITVGYAIGVIEKISD